MILVGQYDFPSVRRTAISLRVLGFACQHDTRAIFGGFDAMRRVNPLGRIPSLRLDDGTVLVDSGAVLDWPAAAPLEARPEFQAPYPADHVVPRSD